MTGNQKSGSGVFLKSDEISEKRRSHFPDRQPEISKPLGPHLILTHIGTRNYQNFELTPPSDQKLVLKIMVLSTLFHVFEPRVVYNGHQ